MKPILVISHERSGTHFLINTIALNFGLSHEVINLPAGDPTQFVTNSWTEPEMIRKSHHQAWWMTWDVAQELTERYSIFYAIRDCRAVIVSLFHYFNTVSTFDTNFPSFERLSDLVDAHPYDWPFDADYSKIQAPNFPERWAIHIDSWQPWFDRMCVVSYEDLFIRSEATVWRIAAYLNRLPVSRPRRPRIDEMYSVVPYRGVFCGWKEEMSQRLSSRICRMVERQRRWLTD